MNDLLSWGQTQFEISRKSEEQPGGGTERAGITCAKTNDKAGTRGYSGASLT